MIKVDQLSKYFTPLKKVVDAISFEVNKGETLVLLGTSGSGKTTTLRMLNRLIEPSSGTITINGQNILQQPADALRRQMGYVLQETGLFPHYTIAENIAIVPGLLQWPKQQTAARTEELLHKLQLPPHEYSEAYPRELSGGQQQRVGLARALAANPPILLMDEPFGALDPITRGMVRKDFMALDELHQKTIVLVTHDVNEAFIMGTQICLMHEGRIAQIGSPATLLFNPANDFVRNFFSEQRLQLELRIMRIHDTWQWLPSAAPGNNAQPLQPGTSYWDALDQLNTGGAFFVQYQGETKSVTSEALFTALNQYKAQKQ
ncbi:ABC transporter ATP-binding protein [Deminuibacter soli]|uniref:ABC transporter ATP-binding protein n=1 Tax=Deminuibacter soli TaxID=2291815 RepID=A0A3E1NK82_9BACT|nr:ABC transporter ATP-binding protein [Deminuibacter soli]RFM28350.1 ABC transporter ATP-binding protein [Deminuibacter soli]